MSLRFSPCLNSRWTHLAGLSFLALVILMLYRPDQQPILGDPAYLIYMAQHVYRGELLYETTTLGYPPFGILLSAFVMNLGQWIGVPSYLAPRCLSIPLALLSSLLLYQIGRRATCNAWVGVIASLALLNFDMFMTRSAANLEPKILVQFFTLIAINAIQTRVWWLVGMASTFAFTCWQPAAIVALCTSFVALRQARRDGRRVVFSYFGGVFLALLPTIIYLSWTGQWAQFAHQTIALKMRSHSHVFSQDPLRILNPIFAVASEERLFVLVAVIGVCSYLHRNYRNLGSSIVSTWSHPRSGGLVLLTLTWVTYDLLAGSTAFEYHGRHDTLPFFYLIAYWEAWAYYRISVWTKGILKNRRSNHWRAQIAGVMMLGFMLLTAGRAATDAFQYEVDYTLSEEELLVRSALSGNVDETSFLSINAEEFYVLTETASSWRYLRLTPYFVDMLKLNEPRGCDVLLEDLDAENYQRIIIKPYKQKTDCLEWITKQLQSSYQQKTLQTSSRNYIVYSLGDDGL